MGAKLAEQADDDLELNHEINVTPFIDVMLVLLIIFMVAAPLSTVDVAVDLPASTAQPAPRPDKPVFLTITPELSLVIGEETVPRTSIGLALDARTGGDKETRIFVRADKSVSYGEVMEAMNLLRAAGYLKIGLVGLEAPQGATEPAAPGAAAPAAPAPAAPAPAAPAPAAPAPAAQ
ncbi:TonB system transport protein ExbD [Methylocella sp.]|uniref:TonB system transport protein ExbD n=1 Tax=Methylocella sp. TaxID=1978226 RepID=UPI0037851499